MSKRAEFLPHTIYLLNALFYHICCNIIHSCMQANLKSQFLLDPSITYLNFGAFGACPRPIFEEYQRIQLELETEPSLFFTRTGPEYLKRSREALAAYINCNADDVVY